MPSLSTSDSSNYEDWGPRKALRIRANYPTWILAHDEDFPGDVWVICPKVEDRCGNAALVDEEKWRSGAHISGSTLTRPCTYCFKAARVPDAT